MQLHDFTIKVKSRFNPVTIWWLGDVHEGSRGCTHEKVESTVQRIADDPNAYWIGMGDYCECINYHDKKRFKPEEIDPSYRIRDLSRLPTLQIENFQKKVRPIAEKCIGLTEGNHEREWEAHHHYNPTHVLAKELGCAYLAYSSITTIKVADTVKGRSNHARYQLDFFSHHGFGTARKEGADLNKVMGFIESILADVYAMGHGHKLLANQYSLVGKKRTRNGTLQTYESPRAFFLTGSYKKVYKKGGSCWEETKGFRPTKLGSPRLIMRMENEELSFECVI